MLFKKNSTLNQIFVLLNTNIIIAIISYGFTLLLIRELSVNEFGKYSYILIVGSIFSLLVSYSTDISATTRFYETKKIDKVISETLSLRLMMFIITLLISVIVGFYNLELAVGIVAISLVSLNFSFIYEINLKNKRYAYIYFIERLFYISISTFIIFFLDFTLLKLFIVLLIITLISISFQIVVLKISINNIDYKEGLASLKYNTPLLLSCLAVYSYGGFSRLILEDKLSLSDLAVYSVGWQFIMIITLFQTQVERIWRIKFSKSIIGNDKFLFKKSLIEFLKFSTLPTIFIAIILFIFSEYIVSFLFSEKYIGLLKIIPIFCCYFIVINIDSLLKMITVSLNSSSSYFVIHSITGILLLFTLSLSPVYDLFYFSILIIAFHFSAIFLLFFSTYFNKRLQYICFEKSNVITKS